MKTKKLKKRSFVGAIALLVISAITLTTSTFAWFSMGQDAKIETMELTVSSPGGFEISANANETGWTSALTPAELFRLGDDGSENYATLVAETDHNYLPAELKPVSCAFAGSSIDFFSAKYAARKAEGPLSQDAVATDPYEGEITNQDYNGFVAFDLYIKSGYATSQNLYFDLSEFAYNENNKNGEGGTALADQHATSALRVGFAKLGTTSKDDYAGAKTLNNFSGATVYEPDSLTRANGSTGSAVSTDYVISATAEGEKATVDDANKVFTNHVAASSATLITDQQDKTEKFIVIEPGINKFRVFIWIEGNDIDCRDSIGSDNLKATFRFQTEQTTLENFPL